jgi:hypothetical protein
MTTIEGNLLIASFMGSIEIDGIYFDLASIKGHELKDELEYHTSWDWLMPVVRKIVTYCIVENDDAFMSDEYTSVLETVPFAIIEDAWKVVVEFIQYYNKIN